MTHIEAFSLGKKFGQPELNEDSMVIMPGRGYAVIDGVTDRNGTRYDGMLSGQFASRLVRDALEEFLLAQSGPDTSPLHYQDPVWLINHLNQILLAGYERNQAGELARTNWKMRAGCTLMLAFQHGDDLQIIAVGDSGIRINGHDMLQVLKPLDDVTAILRRESFAYYLEQGKEQPDAERLASALTWKGTRNQPQGAETADPAVIELLEKRAMLACMKHLPDAPQSELLELVQHGIEHGQGNFQNVDDRHLGYGGLDGFHMPAKYIESRRYKMADIETLELFSDGYFEPAAGFGVSAWEESFRKVEAEDPLKIGRYMSVKGTSSVALTDDRSYLGVRLR